MSAFQIFSFNFRSVVTPTDDTLQVGEDTRLRKLEIRLFPLRLFIRKVLSPPLRHAFTKEGCSYHGNLHRTYRC